MNIGVPLAVLAVGAVLGLASQSGEGQRGGPAPGNAEWELATRPAGFICKSIEFKGRALNYVVYAPRPYHPQSRQRPWPTIVFLHGSGECGEDGMKHLAIGLPQAIIWNRDRWPFLVIMPQKPDAHDQWEDFDA